MRYPTPQSAQRLAERRLEQFLRPACLLRPPLAARAALDPAPPRPAESHRRRRDRGQRRTGPGPGRRSARPSAPRIQQLSAAIAAALAQHADGPLVQSFPRSGASSTPPRSSPSSATGPGPASPPTTSSPPKPASPRSPGPPANTVASPSAGPVINASARPSRRSRTTPVTPRRGPPPSMRAPAPAAVIILTRSRILARACGSVCSGVAGRTAVPTTSRATELPSRSRLFNRWGVDTRVSHTLSVRRSFGKLGSTSGRSGSSPG